MKARAVSFSAAVWASLARAGNSSVATTPTIPPHADDFSVTGIWPVTDDVTIYGVWPHMHLRGKAFKYELVSRNGQRETLLEVPRYDFNWQLRYELKEPKHLREGSRIEVTGVFDNSSGNPANPDPDRIVRWGDQSDE